MPSNLKFSQKILLAASLVTIIAFTLFVLFNDYRQRQTLNADVHASLQEVGSLAISRPGWTAASNWSNPWPSNSPPMVSRASRWRLR
jgi:hypothetical protein